MGFIYLLCFASHRYGHAGHYMGYADTNAEQRISEHRQGNGSHLTRVLKKNGITFDIAFIREGTRDDERRYKNRGGSRKFCPICKAQSLPAAPRCTRKDELNDYRKQLYGCNTWAEYNQKQQENAAQTEMIFGPP